MVSDGPNAFLKAIQKLPMALGGPKDASNAVHASASMILKWPTILLKCYVYCTKSPQADHYR